jgi:hypothetical protein
MRRGTDEEHVTVTGFDESRRNPAEERGHAGALQTRAQCEHVVAARRDE